MSLISPSRELEEAYIFAGSPMRPGFWFPCKAIVVMPIILFHRGADFMAPSGKKFGFYLTSDVTLMLI